MEIFVPIPIKQMSQFGYHRLYNSQVRYSDGIRFHAKPRNQYKGILLHAEYVSRDIYGQEKHRIITESDILKKELIRIKELLRKLNY